MKKIILLIVALVIFSVVIFAMAAAAVSIANHRAAAQLAQQEAIENWKVDYACLDNLLVVNINHLGWFYKLNKVGSYIPCGEAHD
jgi:ABC-type dipeptide/oligopeptide/nickel transport system permease component